MWYVHKKVCFKAKDDSEKWLLILDSRAPKHKLVVMRLGQFVHNRSQKMNMKKIKTKIKVSKYKLIILEAKKMWFFWF
jgi:hypothetical protein